MPRVGSSSSMICGFEQGPTPQYHLLLVAAAQVADDMVGIRGFDVEALDHIVGTLLFLAWVNHAQLADGTQRSHVDIFFNRAAQHQAGILAVFRHVGQTAVD